MRTSCLPSFACVLVVCGLVLIGEAQGATFRFLDGNLFAQVNQDQPLSDVAVDWGDIPGGKMLVEADIEYAGALAAGMIRGGAEVEGVGTSELELNMGAATFGNSQQGGSLELSGGADLVVPGTPGIHFQIVPSAGEAIGDPGRLVFEWMVAGTAGPNSTARIDRGFSPSMALTLNNFPPTDPLQGVVGELDDIFLNEGESLSAAEYVGIIDYHIGDTIGIHMGLGVELTLVDVATGFAEVSSLVRLNIVPEPATLGLCCAGLAAIGALSRR